MLDLLSHLQMMVDCGVHVAKVDASTSTTGCRYIELLSNNST